MKRPSDNIETFIWVFTIAFLILKSELKRKTTMGWLHAYISIAITAGVDGGYEVLPYCACPKCWTLDNDGITCIPSAGKVKTICRPNSISISIDDCVDRNTHDFSGRNSKFFYAVYFRVQSKNHKSGIQNLLRIIPLVSNS